MAKATKKAVAKKVAPALPVAISLSAPITDTNETAHKHGTVWQIIHVVLGVIEEIAQAWRHDIPAANLPDESNN